jgi:hypothetical protein
VGHGSEKSGRKLRETVLLVLVLISCTSKNLVQETMHETLLIKYSVAYRVGRVGLYSLKNTTAVHE